MSHVQTDPIEAFYDRHPYPPPATDLSRDASADPAAQRVAHHLVWPAHPFGTVRSVLVAGCGTSQAARHAMRDPSVQVTGIDVSASSVAHTRALGERHGLTNLEVHHLPIEQVHELDRHFDHVVCTGVLHHLRDPAHGLACLADVMAPGGAITLMVYARHGRQGVYLLQEYCRRLGIGSSPEELADLVATLRELPPAHPLVRLLRDSRDFLDDDALADALLNPRDVAYTVPEVLDLLATAGLRFGRWARQAPYLATCGAITETPHAARIAALRPAEQHAAMELFRGTMTRHTLIAYRDGDAAVDVIDAVDFASPSAGRWIPIAVPTATVVEERLPPGVAAALVNRAHTDTDLVLFADRHERRIFTAIDGTRRIDQLGRHAAAFVERLWEHDLVVIDTSGGAAP